jgi:hypothetical protein
MATLIRRRRGFIQFQPLADSLTVASPSFRDFLQSQNGFRMVGGTVASTPGEIADKLLTRDNHPRPQ